jgi:hypothetical protein
LFIRHHLQHIGNNNDDEAKKKFCLPFNYRFILTLKSFYQQQQKKKKPVLHCNNAQKMKNLNMPPFKQPFATSTVKQTMNGIIGEEKENFALICV